MTARQADNNSHSGLPRTAACCFRSPHCDRSATYKLKIELSSHVVFYGGQSMGYGVIWNPGYARPCAGNWRSRAHGQPLEIANPANRAIFRSPLRQPVACHRLPPQQSSYTHTNSQATPIASRATAIQSASSFIGSTSRFVESPAGARPTNLSPGSTGGRPRVRSALPRARRRLAGDGVGAQRRGECFP